MTKEKAPLSSERPLSYWELMVLLENSGVLDYLEEVTAEAFSGIEGQVDKLSKHLLDGVTKKFNNIA